MFFRESRERKRKIETLRDEIATIRRRWEESLRDATRDEADLRRGLIREDTIGLERELSWLEEKPLRDKADLMGIDIPAEWEYEEESISRSYRRLHRLGKAKLHDAIRQKHREAIKWWIDVLLPIIGAITGLVGTLVALVALRKSK